MIHADDLEAWFAHEAWLHVRGKWEKMRQDAADQILKVDAKDAPTIASLQAQVRILDSLLSPDFKKDTVAEVHMAWQQRETQNG